MYAANGVPNMKMGGHIF